MNQRLAHRAVEKNLRQAVERYIERLEGPESVEPDLLWCQVAEGRRTLEAIDPVFVAVLDNPQRYAGRAELRYARRTLRMLMRQARSAGQGLLASAWQPWLHTLRVADSTSPQMRALGARMWALIEPPRIRSEQGEACLTPACCRFDAGQAATLADRRSVRPDARARPAVHVSSENLPQDAVAAGSQSVRPGRRWLSGPA